MTILKREVAHELITQKFQNTQFVIVSNREPYEHRFSKDKKSIRACFMGGGVVRALDPILQALSGTWIAWGSGNADKMTVDKTNCLKVPEQNQAYTLKRVFLTSREIEYYYFGFANQFLWPFCHNMKDKARFSQAQWEMYKQVNFKFAKATLEVVKKKQALIWLQDYHLALAAQHIREINPYVTLMIFWHIPWPELETFLKFNKARELLRGLLCNDVIAFHTPSFVNHFLESVKASLGLKIKGNKVSFGTRQVTVCAHPISIDTESWMKEAKQIQAEREFTKHQLKELYFVPHLVIGVDRLDYTKGLVQKVRASARFFEKYPQFRGKVIFAQKTMASRSKIKTYQEYASAYLQEVEKVNKKFGTSSWQPFVHLEKDFSHAMLLAFYKRGDLCLVSPIIDGLNLVAKEYVACHVQVPGVLLLSTGAGASEELKGFIPLSPYNTEETARAIYQGLTMPQHEKMQRLSQLQAQIQKNNIFTWLLSNLQEALPYLKGKKSLKL